MNKKLFGNCVLIEPDKISEETTTSGIIVKKSVEMGDFRTGIVKEVGSGKQTDYGHIVKPQVNKDERVMFQFGKPILVDGEIYLLVQGEDIILVL